MHVVPGVQILQGSCDVESDVDDIADRQPAKSVQQGMSAGAIDVFHDQVMLARRRVLAGGNAANDVGMIQQGSALGFAMKAIQVGPIERELIGKDLDGELSISCCGTISGP